MKIKYPIYQPSLSGNEKKYVNECIDSSWISAKGKFVDKFENAFADYIKVNHAVTICNGTAALHLALLALGIRSGDEVIVPTLTYIASVNAITYTGAKPVFVDSLPDTWQMNPEDVKKKITPNTKAVLAVHLYGHPCEMNSIVSICKENNLFLIEDCAEAIGSLYKDRHVGVFGDIASFSFYGNKTITTGEGGMIVTNDKNLYKKAVHYKGQGLAEGREYWHDVVGYNYRMTNICAAIGLAQLEQVDRFIAKKVQIAKWYKDRFKDTNIVFHNSDGNVRHSYWMCSIIVDNPQQREGLRKHLAQNGIETRPLFYPIHTMPIYFQNNNKYKVAEDLSSRGISLPSYPDLNIKNIEFITNLINIFIE